MPQIPVVKPHLIGVEFRKVQSVTANSRAEEYEVNVTWTGTPADPHPSTTYTGTLSTTREVALRDDEGTPLFKWSLSAIPVTAEFLVPMETEDVGARTAKRTAELILKAAYVGCGYKTMFPLSQTGQL